MRLARCARAKGRIRGLAFLAAAVVYGWARSADPVILPIDRAKFLAGQKFDFLVEAREGGAEAISVSLNGRPAEEFFGKAGEFKNAGGVASYRINGVAFNSPGLVEAVATAKRGGGTASARARYSVAGEKAERRAKNVILFIGDGMGLPIRDMARILSRNIGEGKYGDILEMEKLTNVAIVTTSGYDSLVTDSANSASAYATGHKSVVNAMGVYESSDKNPQDHPKVENLAEIGIRTRGMSVGLVTTSNITDATPAAMIAHTRRRAEQNFIAQDMLNPAHMPEVILGGGSRHFLPQSTPGSKRTDERNLVEEFRAKGFEFAGNRAEMLKVGGNRILGLFNLDNLNVYLDREVFKDPETLGSFTDQPTLVEMTEKAIEILSRNPNGFFLMVEGACVDKQLHTMDWQRSVYDAIELDQAVGVARRFAAGNGETLILVTADHSHGASITGTYHERDGRKGRHAVRTYANSVFPTFADRDGDGFPEDPDPEVTLAVHFANHPDFNADYHVKRVPTAPAIKAGEQVVANPQTEGEPTPGNLPHSETQEVHSADSVPLNAGGPGEEYFRGVMDNTEVFHGMARALGLDGRE
ncbi:MAG: alkaline phosphatase [Planctomycetota bacterium]|jgi:alkaline phosphatase|nr:alkaline phosphatase [Planctomycetota bacterium]